MYVTSRAPKFLTQLLPSRCNTTAVHNTLLLPACPHSARSLLHPGRRPRSPCCCRRLRLHLGVEGRVVNGRPPPPLGGRLVGVAAAASRRGVDLHGGGASGWRLRARGGGGGGRKFRRGEGRQAGCGAGSHKGKGWDMSRKARHQGMCRVVKLPLKTAVEGRPCVTLTGLHRANYGSLDIRVDGACGFAGFP